MAEHLLDHDLTADSTTTVESTRTRHLDEDDTQVVTIDCTYAMYWLSEIDTEYSADDPEVVELIGLNAAKPRR